MGFLIRVAFCLMIVILFIPADETETRKLADGRSISTFEAFGLAAAIYQDARGFCGRNPDACETGQIALATFGAKARTGARWIYSLFDPAPAAAVPETPSAQPMPPPISHAPKADSLPASTSSIKEHHTQAITKLALQAKDKRG